MKVLYVGFELVGEDSATGRTLSNMLTGIDNVEYMQVCLQPIKSYTTINNTIFIKPSDSFVSYFISRYSLSKKKLQQLSVNLLFKKNSLSTTPSSEESKKSKLKRFIIRILRERSIHISGAVFQKVKIFNPDLIYTLGGCSAVLKASVDLAKKLNKHIVIHSMDDYFNTVFTSKTLINSFLRKKYVGITYLSYSLSKMSLGISELMANEYSKTFNLPFSYAMNCVSEFFSPKRITADKTQYNVYFSGGLHGGRINSIIMVANLFKRINDRNQNKKLILTVFTDKPNYASFGGKINECASIVNYVPHDEMISNLRKADLLLHVESFDEYNKRYFRLSMSTKIPEYMAAGIPIICFGPNEICTVKFLKDNKCGITAENESELEQVLYAILNNKINLEELAEKACDVCREKFSKNVVQERIEKCFSFNSIE